MSSTIDDIQMLIDVYKEIFIWILNFASQETTETTPIIEGFENATIDMRVKDACKCLILNDNQLRRVMKALHEGMEKGLRKGSPPGSLDMIPSYVRALPNGKEDGDFLALDLGGTNFRILLIRLKGTQAEMKSKSFDLPISVQRGTGEALFDHIVQCIAVFTEEHFGKEKKKLPLAFTFSFPTKFYGLTKGILIRWTKGFCASGVEGKDVVRLLRKACKKRSDIDIDVVAILNDTVGTLMACAFDDSKCQMGVIVGTGTNACYMEKLQNVHKIKGEWENDGLPDEMIIDIEWGGFGDDGSLSFVFTDYDEEIDAKSLNPKRQLFEKMISGMYMGELVRIILELLARNGVLFKGDYSAISKRDCFTTKYVSEVESEVEEKKKTTSYPKTLEILKKIGVKNVSDADCLHVAYVCTVISTRAAYLSAAAFAQVLNRMRRPYKVTVGVDGSVYRFHSTFKRLLEKKIYDLIDKGIQFQLKLSVDGSGVGAAVVAAVASRIKREITSRSDKT